MCQEGLGIRLSSKGFKSARIDIFKELKEAMFKELKESMTAMSHQIENFSNEIEIIFFKNQRNSRVEKYSN